MKKLFVLFLGIVSWFNVLSQCGGTALLNPSTQSINNSYEPGQTVEFCYELSQFSELGTNWIEGFTIEFEEGWGDLVITQFPNNASSAGEWIWDEDNPTPVGNVGPGFFYDNNNNGSSIDDFGDMGVENRTFCFELTVEDECGLGLGITIEYAFDGFWGSFVSTSCDQSYTDNFFVGFTSGEVVNTGPITHNFIPCPDTTCTGSEVMYSVTGNQSSTYEWHVTGGGLLTTDLTNDCEIIWGDIPGTYTITVQETTERGCIGVIKTCDVELIIPDITFNHNSFSMCLNSSDDIIPFPQGGSWSSEFMNGNTFVGTKPGTYHPSYLTNIHGCDIQEEVEVVVKRKYEAPNIIYSAELIDLCFDSGVQTYIAEDTVGVTYGWFIDEVKQLSNENNMTIEWYDTTRTYIVKVIAYDEIGCESEPKLISVKTESCQRFFAPNSFTPNGDGTNDIFEVRGLSVYRPMMRVFNRWGVVVYESSNLWWTGDSGSGYYCDNGVYNWIIEYKDKFGQNKQESGYVTLIR